MRKWVDLDRTEAPKDPNDGCFCSSNVGLCFEWLISAKSLCVFLSEWFRERDLEYKSCRL